MRRKVVLLLLAIILVISNFPPYQAKVSAAEKTQAVKKNIPVPDPIVTANGVKWYATSRSGELGTVDISSLNLPNSAVIKSVQLWDMNGNYVKHLNDKTGTVYRIGTVPNVGEATLTSTIQTALGYFDWFRVGNLQNYWAFDLDGVRHIRQYGHNTDYPVEYGLYSNKEKTDGLPSSFYSTGNIPSWYSYSHPNYLKVFADETNGKANIGWAERNLDISGATFKNDSLGITGISINKLDNVNINASDVVYKEPNQPRGSIPASDILDKIVMEDSATMIANRKAKIWFSARMGWNYHHMPQSNGTHAARYYNQWEVTLTSKIYKYTEYQVVVVYDDGPTGDAVLTLTADVPTCPIPNETIQIRAKITKKDGYVWEFLTTTPHAKLAYKSSNTTVATVSNTGLITLKSAGDVVITATYTEGDGSAPIVETINITVSADLNSCNPTSPPPSGGGTGGTCDFIISSGATGGTMQQSFLNANPTGFIDSATGQFDVVQGIPSSESLKTQATMPKYLFDQNYEQKTGKVTYTISVTKNFILQWEETPPANPNAGPDDPPPSPEQKSEEMSEEIQVQVEREFSYWNVTKFDVWTADNALITNYALPNGQSLMTVNDRVTANAVMDMDVNNHVFPTDCEPIELPPETIDGGTSKPSIPDFESDAKAEAEGKITPPNVKNDRAVFNGTTLMSDSMTSGGHAPSPSNIPMPSDITVNNNNLLIDPTKTNYWQSPSTGKVSYQGVFGLNGMPSLREFAFAVNPVTVHTPVVIYATATDDKEHDQRINPPIRSTPANPSVDRHAFILDKPFTVTLPTAGEHRNIPGYGNRDFSKYIKKKQVMFPFDVYTETKQGYYPANTWIDIPVNMDDATFFLPVWVPEGQYVMQFRSFAINALDSGDFGGTEEKANITIPNPNYNVAPAGTLSAAHVAETSINVDVVGRLYDFQVTDIKDYNWKNVFRNSDMTASGKSYFVGLKDINNAPRGNNSPYVLPISHASNPNGIKNLAVKQGYSFSFNFKTKGDMQSATDAIRITPRFYYVRKDGTGRQEVDLYYHDNTKQFIKIGSNDDQTYRTVKLNETSRNVSTTEIANNANYYFNNVSRFNLTNDISGHTRNSYARSYAKYFSKDEIETGPYSWQILNWKLRTYRGPQKDTVPANTMIPSDEIVTKEQTWYGEYSIPAKTYAVSKNAPLHEAGRLGVLNDNHPIFLKDGYIIVNFDIETINDGDLANPYLSYYNAFYMSQWTDMEEFQPSFVDRYGYTFNNLEGDVIYYHAGLSSQDDFSPSVTH